MDSANRLRIKAARQETDACVATVFGKFEEAAAIHARIARMFWTARMFDSVASSIINASECLMKADMPEDAFDGIRSASIMMINNSQVCPAIKLGGYVRVLEYKYPNSFKNSSAPFQAFVYDLCKEKHLIE